MGIQSCEAFNHVMRDMSAVVDEFESLSFFSAGIDRLSTFMKTMRDVDLGRPVDSALMKRPDVTAFEVVSPAINQDYAATNINLIWTAPVGHAPVPGANILTVKDLTLLTPDRKRLLIKDLDLSLKPGENLLIVGNSGAGKSSFLRALAGLWTAGSGVLERPPNDEVYFLPQKPYCFAGSLKDHLLYPNIDDFDIFDNSERELVTTSHSAKRSLSYQDLHDILKAVGLEKLPKRAGDGDLIRGWNKRLDWGNTLSLGEQQRLAFGRLLVQRPRLAILDESTSALDFKTEAAMYKLLEDMARDNDMGLTYITVGHRANLLWYHDWQLQLNGGGRHTTQRIDQSLLASIDATETIQVSEPIAEAVAPSTEKLYTESEMSDIVKAVRADVEKASDEIYRRKIDGLKSQIKVLREAQSSG